MIKKLSDDAEVQVAESFQQALEALRSEPFDLVVSEQSDFLALERAAGSQQATLILESIGQGVCIVDTTGRLLYANAKMRAFPPDLTVQICQACKRWFAPQSRDEPSTFSSAAAAPLSARRFSLTATGDQYFDVTATPVLGQRQEAAQIVAVVWDVTASCRLQQKLNAIDLAGRELVSLGSDATARMNIEDRISLLEEKILRYMRELMHFDNFAVMLIDKKSNKLEFVLQHGISERGRARDFFVSLEGSGISGYVAATGRSYICHDAANDPRYIEGLESARSSLTVPLRLQDKIIGVFDIESEQTAAFNEDDRQFAEILGRYIAIALNTLDLMVTERHVARNRLAEDVLSEIAGPLNDILTEANTLTEEYVGFDDLRRRLHAIGDGVAQIRKNIREVAVPTGGVLGLRADAPARDPLLAGRRILVADDDPVIRETLCGVLSSLGCDVETAADGASAVTLIESRVFDAVLADIKMPHKNGFEVFNAAKRARASTGVVLMTGFGYDPNHSIVRARQEGLAAVLFKPFKIEQLIEALHVALAPAP